MWRWLHDWFIQILAWYRIGRRPSANIWINRVIVIQLCCIHVMLYNTRQLYWQGISLLLAHACYFCFVFLSCFVGFCWFLFVFWLFSFTICVKNKMEWIAPIVNTLVNTIMNYYCRTHLMSWFKYGRLWEQTEVLQERSQVRRKTKTVW